mmetsp:Transcript_33265/g.94637  ORF Transcript_33265/g.94637 Transcript_33265/m.94637 type:complete len:207 (-) Transcript_33265:2-622(-)
MARVDIADEHCIRRPLELELQAERLAVLRDRDIELVRSRDHHRDLDAPLQDVEHGVQADDAVDAHDVVAHLHPALFGNTAVVDTDGGGVPLLDPLDVQDVQGVHALEVQTDGRVHELARQAGAEELGARSKARLHEGGADVLGHGVAHAHELGLHVHHLLIRPVLIRKAALEAGHGSTAGARMLSRIQGRGLPRKGGVFAIACWGP